MNHWNGFTVPGDADAANEALRARCERDADEMVSDGPVQLTEEFSTRMQYESCRLLAQLVCAPLKDRELVAQRVCRDAYKSLVLAIEAAA